MKGDGDGNPTLMGAEQLPQAQDANMKRVKQQRRWTHAVDGKFRRVSATNNGLRFAIPGDEELLPVINKPR